MAFLDAASWTSSSSLLAANVCSGGAVRGRSVKL